MKPILLIARRELAAYLRTWTGYVIIAAVLAVGGLIYQGYVIGGDTSRRSAEVVNLFFIGCSGAVMIASPLIAMRLLAGERENGTIALLYSSPVREHEIVTGKFLSALGFLAILLLTTLYMPLMVMINGKISWGHVLTGYLGTLLLGSASLAICTFGSSLVKSQVLSAVVSTCLMLSVLTIWWVARVTERPFPSVFESLALWNQHFPPFATGIIHLRDVVYYLAVSYVFLFGSTRVLEARRWR
jgi:ABC-2 type transport system permease protein